MENWNTSSLPVELPAYSADHLCVFPLAWARLTREEKSIVQLRNMLCFLLFPESSIMCLVFSSFGSWFKSDFLGHCLLKEWLKDVVGSCWHSSVLSYLLPTIWNLTVPVGQKQKGRLLRPSGHVSHQHHSCPHLVRTAANQISFDWALWVPQTPVPDSNISSANDG